MGWDLLSGEVSVPARVMVFDGTGGYPGPSVAEFAARQQAARGDIVNVELVTQERNVATSIGALNYPVFMENLYTLGVHITPDHRLVNVEPVDTASGSSSRRITLRNVFTNQTSERIVDQ